MTFKQRLCGTHYAGVSVFSGMLTLDEKMQRYIVCTRTPMEYPFLELPNVLGSPHNSAVVSHVLEDAARQAAENVKHFLKGEKVMGIARREDYLW